MISDSIASLNEEALLGRYGFLLSNYNGMQVWYNPKLTKHFFKERGRKHKIVLHHTAGSLEGDINALTTDSKVSVPFLISPKGKIIMLYQPWNWAYHLGKDALGGNTSQSKISIGIEISNWGFLVKKGDILYTYKGQPYCDISQTDLYEKGEKWKIFNNSPVEYFATYSESQYESVKKLKNLLCRLYAIPDVLYTKGYSEEVVDFRGITTHTDFRRDKYDLSPTFKFDKI